jgi:hypothetical protein
MQLDLKVRLAQLVQLVLRVRLAQLVQLVLRVRLAQLVQLALQEPMEPTVLPVPRVTRVQRVPGGLMVCLSDSMER